MAAWKRRINNGEQKVREHGNQSWSEKNSFAVFVDNLPIDSTKEWLWRVFSSVGEVVDIYLSRKTREKNPLRFSFVRYVTRREAMRAIQQLDGWIVWGHSLRLMESKYRRGAKGRQEKTRKEEEDNGGHEERTGCRKARIAKCREL
ncbi:hypothetical protein PIB30_018591 [Stylosanthes scabra]|uniref:RRM domain-containing protein n=1 Tax=Stylosanthes scabra TaxID=79078 RepID=A0ABU6S860_9FABA|nr:hypothetical protein [Stylosanthes scabra]